VLTYGMCAAFLAGTMPQPVRAQDSSPSSASATAADEGYSNEQLDALLAPIALYPDQLLTQILMASTFPDEIQAADTWVKEPANKSLTGDALDKAMTPLDWDPSVKSLVPFPQVLDMMSKNIDWTNQLGYAMEVQQSDVLASVQRLRTQAQNEGQLKSNEQQTVTTEGSSIVIVPAQPSVVYVPAYNPAVVYGAWPYPAYPPVYYPPPYGYYPGSALVAGMAFGAGIAITAGLWGWASPGWGHGSVNVNVNRYNNINANGNKINSGNWNANRNGGGNRTNIGNGSGNRNGIGNGNGVGNGNRNGVGNGVGNGNRGNGRQPPSGPVGKPSPRKGMPANSIGRSNVGVPGGITKPPAGMGAGNRANGGAGMGQGSNRPAAGNRPQAGTKPAFSAGNIPGSGNRASAGTMPAGGNRAAGGNRTAGGNRGGGSPGAFNGMGDGRSASQYGNRGAQSQRMSSANRSAGANRGGGGFSGGGGGARGGGGGRGGGGRR
jgi:hypothetical protein